MADPIPLDEQIVAALTGDCTSDQAAAVVTLATAALRDLTTQADAADVESLSPLQTSAGAMALRRKAGDLRFEADRMEASVSALEVRAANLRDAEQRSREDAKRQAVLADRDALAADIARDYPRLARELTVLAKRIHDCDEACRVVGVHESAEAIGRGIPANFYMHGGPVYRLSDMRVAMPGDARLAWEAHPMGWRWHGLDIPEPANVEQPHD